MLHVQREDNKQKVRLWAWRQGGDRFSSSGQGLIPPPCLGLQGDVVLQSDHVIETLTKTALSADRVSNVNINQGR